MKKNEKEYINMCKKTSNKKSEGKKERKMMMAMRDHWTSIKIVIDLIFDSDNSFSFPSFAFFLVFPVQVFIIQLIQ